MLSSLGHLNARLHFRNWRPYCPQSLVLAYSDFTAKFILNTDASNHGIRAVLSKLKDGVEHPVTYASRTLTHAERNYCVTRKNYLQLRPEDCKYRELIFKTEITDFLIFYYEKPFAKLFSKINLKLAREFLVLRNPTKSRIVVFALRPQ